MELSNAAVETLIFRARRSLADLLSGKPAPKRAGRFAFFPGAIAAACKGFMGSGTVAKLAAGLAAALVATTVAGSTEVPRSAAGKRTASAPVVAPHQLAQHPTKATAARHHAALKRHSKSRPSTPSEKPQAPTRPLKAVENPVKTVNETGAQALETVRNVIAPATDTLPALGVELP
jgi:hypothetical protein